MKLLILIPAYNEEETIADVILETQKSFPDTDICVVNDGSEDRTGDILKENTAIISLHLPYNMGIGGALWTGFNYFCQKDYEFLLRLDSDGQHPPSEAAKLLEPLTQGEADLVIGSRFINREGYLSSQLRRGGIKLLKMLTAIIMKNQITDNTSGFRAYSRKAVCLLTEDYPFDYPEPIEVYLLNRNGLRIKEIPIKMTDRQGGVSSINTLRTYYYLIKVLLTILVNFWNGGRNESLSDQSHPDI